MKLCFFYGSLREGYWNNGILTPSSTKLTNAETVEPFALYIGRQGTVPTTVPSSGTVSLKGELWSLSERDAARVQMLESGYEEGVFPVRRQDTNEVVEATLYYHKNPLSCSYLRGEPVLVPSGDYTEVIGPDGERKAA